MKRLSSLYTIGKYHSTLMGLSPANSINNFNNNRENNNNTVSNYHHHRTSNRLSSLLEGIDLDDTKRNYFKSSHISRFANLNNNNNNNSSSNNVVAAEDVTPTTPKKRTRNSKKKNTEEEGVVVSTTTTTTTTTTTDVIVPQANLSLEELLQRASDYVTAGKNELAISDLNESIARAPLDARGFGLRADLYEHMGNYTLALADYRKVLELVPESIPCLSNIADCYASMSNYEMATKFLQQAIAFDGNFVPALGSLGDIKVKFGELDEALQLYKKVVELQPNNLNGLLGLGHVAMKQGNTDSAQKLYQQVIKAGSTTNEHEYSQTVGLGGFNPRIKRSGESNPVYSAAICLASIYEKAGRTNQSLEAAQLALKLHPNSIYAHSIIASIWMRKKEPEKSLNSIDAALALEPKNEYAMTIRADCLMDLNRYNEALQTYRELIAYMMERDQPEEASTRIAILHNMIVAYVAKLGSVSDVELDINTELDIEKDALNDVLSLPENMQDLSKRARQLSKIIKGLSIMESEDKNPTKDYLSALVEALHHLALSANEALQIRHNQKVEVDKDELLNPFEKILYDYYTMVASSFVSEQ